MLIDRFSYSPVQALVLPPKRFTSRIAYKDDGGEVGGSGGSTKTDDKGEGEGTTDDKSGSGTPPKQKADDKTPKKGGKLPDPDPETGLISLTKDQLVEFTNDVVEKRLLRDRERQQKESQDATDKAEAERLKTEQKYQELSEKQAKQIAELKPKADAFDRLKEIVTSQQDAEIADWPDEARDLIPDGLDLEARTKMIEKIRPLAKRLAGGDKGDDGSKGDDPDKSKDKSGNKPDPKEHDKGGSADEAKAAAQEHDQLYRRF